MMLNPLTYEMNSEQFALKNIPDLLIEDFEEVQTYDEFKMSLSRLRELFPDAPDYKFINEE